MARAASERSPDTNGPKKSKQWLNTQPSENLPPAPANLSTTEFNTSQASSIYATSTAASHTSGSSFYPGPSSTVPTSVSGRSDKSKRLPLQEVHNEASHISVVNGISTGSPVLASQPSVQPKTPEHQSKTSIGRLTYSIATMPKVLVANLKVESHEMSSQGLLEWQAIKGRKLRRLVVAKYLAKAGQNSYIIDFPPDQTITRVVVRICDENHGAVVQGKLNIAMADRSDLTKATRQDDNTVLQHRIRCKIASYLPEDVAAGFIESLLRASARQPNLLRPLTGLPKTIAAGLNNIASDVDAVFKLHVRMQPSVNLEECQVHLDFDLVPCVPTIPVAEVLASLLGYNEPTIESIAQNFKAIKRILCGLKVRCTYQPDGKSEDGHAKVKILHPSDASGRVFQIEDIKLSSDPETSFSFKGKRRSVCEYFSNVALPNGRTVNRNIPLAKDATGAWIPLELLICDGPQPLHGLGHRNGAVRDSIKTFLRKGGIDCLRALGKDLLDQYATINPGNGLDIQPWLVTALGTSTPNGATKDSKPGRIGVAHVLLTDIPDIELMTRLIQGLNSHHYNVSKDTLVIDSLEMSKKLSESDFDLLLAVVDDRNSDKDGIREFVARFRQTAELEWGARVICLDRSHLLNLFRNRYDPGTYLPSSIRAKINCMLGHQNFEEPQLQEMLADSNIMIAGAHIAHPSSEDKKYHPSVAAVVATKPGSTVQYAGTARLQATTEKPMIQALRNSQPVASASKKAPRHFHSKIDNLQAMMRDLFSKWEDNAPAELIFFRDSIALKDKDATFWDERDQIQAAYQEAFPAQKGTLKLTYALVEKNSSSLTGPVEPEDYVADGDCSRKHMYHIVENGGSRSAADLAKLTGRLNESSQLNTQLEQTSKALPLLWASKLCSRMHDYVRFAQAPGEWELPTFTKIKFPSAKDIADFADAEREAVNAAKGRLKIDGNDASRQVPWPKQLDGTMFYL